jgi:hypothetical protein
LIGVNRIEALRRYPSGQRQEMTGETIMWSAITRAIAAMFADRRDDFGARLTSHYGLNG